MDKTVCWFQQDLQRLNAGKWRTEKAFQRAVALIKELLCVICCAAILLAPLVFGSQVVLAIHELTRVCLTCLPW